MLQPSTVFSACRRYRYSLWRSWGVDRPAMRFAMFVGLNPSTADETVDDPTIRRCIGYARAWGFNALCMTNLFAFRTTRPQALKREPNPIGPENDSFIRRLARRAAIVIAAWGIHGAFRKRDLRVLSLLKEVHCLRLTTNGHPAHPLYLPVGLTPIPLPRA